MNPRASIVLWYRLLWMLETVKTPSLIIKPNTRVSPIPMSDCSVEELLLWWQRRISARWLRS